MKKTLRRYETARPPPGSLRIAPVDQHDLPLLQLRSRYARRSCRGGGNLDPDEPDKLPDVAAYKVPDVVEMGFADTFLLPCSGAGTDDYLLLTARNDASEIHRMPVTEVDQTQGASLQTPAGFIGGMYDFTFYKNGKALDLGTAFVDVVDRTEVPQVPGSTVYGRVIDHTGKPIAGVSVSDGVFVTATDDEGRYYLSSLKQRGYVFITVPAGYRAAVNRTIPQFFRRLSGSPQTYEQRSFVLAPETNERHRMIVFTDTHLANRTNDIHQFENGFKADLRKQIAQAKAEGVSLYAMALGDLTWDEYWYKNSYQPSHYVRQMADLDIPIYNIPGKPRQRSLRGRRFRIRKPVARKSGSYLLLLRHRRHPLHPARQHPLHQHGRRTGNRRETRLYGGTDGRPAPVARSRPATGSGRKTVFVGMHIQFTNRYRIADGKLSWSYAMPADCRAKMLDLLSPYTVHFVTGHTHINYANRITERMTEHNIAAVCATWWWTGNYTNGRTQMCRDGAPAGYGLFEIGTAGANDAMALSGHRQGSRLSVPRLRPQPLPHHARQILPRHQEQFRDGQRRILRAVRQRLRPSALGQRRADQRLQLEREMEGGGARSRDRQTTPRRTGRHLRPAAYDPFQHEPHEHQFDGHDLPDAAHVAHVRGGLLLAHDRAPKSP